MSAAGFAVAVGAVEIEGLGNKKHVATARGVKCFFEHRGPAIGWQLARNHLVAGVIKRDSLHGQQSVARHALDFGRNELFLRDYRFVEENRGVFNHTNPFSAAFGRAITCRERGFDGVAQALFV